MRFFGFADGRDGSQWGEEEAGEYGSEDERDAEENLQHGDIVIGTV